MKADYIPSPMVAMIDSLVIHAMGHRVRRRERANATRLLNPARASELLALGNLEPTKGNADETPQLPRSQACTPCACERSS